MLTDVEAHALLREAAETIDVTPAGPIEIQPTRPRRPLLAAAAAVVAVAVAGGLSLVQAGDDQPAPTRPPEGSPATASPQPPMATCGPHDLCKGVIVPSLLGLQEAEAREWLESSGHDVTTVYVDREGCQPDGMVLAQKPRAGTTSPLGATVRLTVNRNADDFCSGLPGPG